MPKTCPHCGALLRKAKPYLKLSQRLEVRRRYNKGELTKLIAYDFGITPQRAGQIAREFGAAPRGHSNGGRKRTRD